MKRIEEGVYQLVSPFPQHRLEDAYRVRTAREQDPRSSRGLAYILPYFLSSRGDNLLVDCGWNTDESMRALAAQLREAGASLMELRRLVITHTHPDHCGLAGRIKGQSGCELAVHELDLGRIESQCASDEHIAAIFDRWCDSCGVPHEDRTALAYEELPRSLFATPFDIDMCLKGGEVLQVGEFDLEIVWTPGHTPGHVCLFERTRGILFTGDHVLPWITPNVSLDPYQRPNPLQDFLESLKKLRSLPVKRMLPAHEWDTADFSERVSQLLDHHEARLHEISQILSSIVGGTALDVARQVRWTTGSYARFTQWMQRAALGEALAHLIFLASQGRAIQYQDGGLQYFQAN